MENGSILPQALNYMQKLRDYDLDNSSHPYLTSSSDNGERNSLIISLYHIGDSPNGIDNRAASDSDSANLRSNLHRKLASIHSILHTKLLPRYQNHYSHTWFAGGEGITFGLHCSSHSESEDDVEDSVPHLRAVVHYGPHPCDEYFALAIVFQLTQDLKKIHGIQTAASCWDADDGQILLIEGADTLPSWVDDDIGVKGMANRVFVVGGVIILLPPRFQSAYDHLKCAGCLTTREALLILIQHSAIINPENGPSTFRKEMILKELNEAVRRKIAPFYRVIQKDLKNINVRETLKEHIHAAAVVLPLNLALLIRKRPDLIPCAILTFCKLSPLGIVETNNKKSGGQRNDSKESKEELIPFENLVFTTITLSKTLYAMLLTAAGKMQPPIKIPKRYRSVELNRMKRKVASGDVFQYYRHALEVGVRLALGFEWLSQNSLVQQHDSSAPNHSTKGVQEPKEDLTVCLSTENRMMVYHNRIDVETGGDGEWIRRAWADGPNLTCSENNISALVKCPVWYPEIAKGGIDPIRNPGKAISAHIRETLLRVQKEESTSKGILQNFPPPRICDVDSDSWIDMDSIEALENKMNNVAHDRTSKTKKQEDLSINSDVLLGTHKTEQNENNSQSHSSDNINAILSGLQSFMKSDSGAEGVVMGTKGYASNVNTNSYHNKPTAPGPKSVLDKIHINHRVFIKTLYNSASECSADKMRPTDDNELLQYFSRADLEVLGEEYSEMDDGMQCNTTENSDGLAKMHCLMNTMDEELIHHKLDRNCGDLHDLSTCDTLHLPPNDPIVEDLDILSNLMKSLEVQGGSSGPVTTILEQMGIGKPDCT